MTSRLLLAAAVAGLLWPAAPVAAEPIEWEYRVTVSSVTGGDRLFLGSHLHDGPDGMEPLYATASLPAASPTAGVLSGSQTGLRLAGMSKQDFMFTGDPAVAMSDSLYKVRVAVTDRASGRTGEAVLVGTPLFSTGLPLTLYGGVTLGGQSESTLILGDNRYDVRITGSESESNAWLTANVTVSPAADSPEPGTLALAAVGVAAMGAWKRKRRG